jgi:hypothetical protein
MTLPTSCFYQIFKQNTLIVIDRAIWNIKNRREDKNYFRWYSRTFGIEKGSSLRALEEDYLEKHQEQIKQLRDESASRLVKENTDEEEIRLAHFAINNIVRRSDEEEDNSSYTIEEALDRDAFVCEGTLFHINKNKNNNHEIKIGERAYSIDKKIAEVEQLEEEYKRKLQERITGWQKKIQKTREITRILEEGGFYDRKSGIGFEKTRKGFFVYTITEPYALYERENNKHYGFPRAKIAIQVEQTEGGVAWHDAIVMNKYMHPALHDNAEYQNICTGKFSYNTIRERCAKKSDQIRVALQTARDMMERGYFSRKGSWNALTDPKYKDMEITNLERWRVTNT